MLNVIKKKTCLNTTEILIEIILNDKHGRERDTGQKNHAAILDWIRLYEPERKRA